MSQIPMVCTGEGYRAKPIKTEANTTQRDTSAIASALLRGKLFQQTLTGTLQNSLRVSQTFKQNPQRSRLREMYLYKATCSEIPNLKPKGVQKASGNRTQTRISRENSVDKAYPFMCWSGLRTNTQLELKHLEEFLNTHTVSLQDSVPAVTGMVYRYTTLCALVCYLLHSTLLGKKSFFKGSWSIQGCLSSQLGSFQSPF